MWRNSFFGAGLLLGLALLALSWQEGNPWLVVVTGLFWAWWVVSVGLFVHDWQRPVQQLTQVMRRLLNDDAHARLLPVRRDAVGELILAFNALLDHHNQRLTTLTAEWEHAQQVVNTMADGVIITDLVGRVTALNPAARTLLKTQDEEVSGRTLAEVVRHHEVIDLWQRCRAQQMEQTAVVELGYKKLFLQVIVTPLRETGQRGYLVILQDLTQIRRLQTIRQDFISNISHELRTPLASLRAVIETLQDGALDDPPAAQRFLNQAEGEIDTLTQMVQELLELSRIESGQVPLRLTTTPVSQIIWPVVERLHSQAQRAGVVMEVFIPPSVPPVLADESRVQQVVSNLLHNAIKFTPAGGKVTITATTSREYPDMLLLQVADTGIGIPARDLPRIFERFYKTDRARSQGGTGLGLAIAKHLVQAHGGHIWARSKEGQGSQFQFTLPLADEALTMSSS